MADSDWWLKSWIGWCCACTEMVLGFLNACLGELSTAVVLQLKHKLSPIRRERNLRTPPAHEASDERLLAMSVAGRRDRTSQKAPMLSQAFTKPENWTRLVPAVGRIFRWTPESFFGAGSLPLPMKVIGNSPSLIASTGERTGTSGRQIWLVQDMPGW